jgi:hypothetical protein
MPYGVIIKRRREWMGALEDRQLIQVVHEPDVQVYMLKKPDRGRMGSTQLVFTKEGIVIMGDLCPGLNGCISAYGYGINWFAGQLGGSYLGEKFLAKGFHPEAAADEMRDPNHWIHGDPDDADDPEAVAELERDIDELCTKLQEGECSHEGLYDWMIEHGIDTADGTAGWCYDPHDLGMLCEIQRVFSSKYKEIRDLTPPTNTETPND